MQQHYIALMLPSEQPPTSGAQGTQGTNNKMHPRGVVTTQHACKINCQCQLTGSSSNMFATSRKGLR